jgi:hypothetical protein
LNSTPQRSKCDNARLARAVGRPPGVQALDPISASAEGTGGWIAVRSLRSAEVTGYQLAQVASVLGIVLVACLFALNVLRAAPKLCEAVAVVAPQCSQKPR